MSNLLKVIYMTIDLYSGEIMDKIEVNVDKDLQQSVPRQVLEQVIWDGEDKQEIITDMLKNFKQYNHGYKILGNETLTLIVI